MFIKINRVSSKHSWYKNKIGMFFRVVDPGGLFTCFYVKSLPGKVIKKIDCEIVTMDQILEQMSCLELYLMDGI
jgi:hypothetical protein